MGAESGSGLTSSVTEDGFVAAIEQTGWTTAVPSEYFSDASEQNAHIQNYRKFVKNDP